jgi:hypothetical protein
MREEVRDAIESVSMAKSGRQRGLSEATIRRIVLAVVRDLPEEMTVMELREELE